MAGGLEKESRDYTLILLGFLQRSIVILCTPARFGGRGRTKMHVTKTIGRMEKVMGRSLRAALILSGVLVSAAAKAEDDASSDPNLQRTLRALRDVSTIDHPDIFGMTVGLRRYAHRQFKDALKYFESGAYYADKLSQLCIGLMYMNGEGVARDPVTAYAWLDLAAERDYPDFVATRDSLKAKLTSEQLAQAQSLRMELGKRYGDAVAKYRMEVQLRVGLMNAFTGSRTGYDSGDSINRVRRPAGRFS